MLAGIGGRIAAGTALTRSVALPLGIVAALGGATGSLVWLVTPPGVFGRVVPFLVAAGGQLATRIAGKLPLAQAAETHRQLAAGGASGKLVLIP
jgi:hypothetical protein